MRVIACLLALLSTAASSASAAEPAVPAFAAGDSVCFVGDSITHGGAYHANVLLFYATRLPTARFALHNCGLSGDSAAGAVRRFDYDIAVHKPTVATIMLGMNDVNRGLYGADKVADADRTRQQAAIDAHARSMEELAKRLRALGSRIVVFTPSIYDQTGSQKTANLFGVNDALARCGELGRELAARHQGTVVDFHGPMTRINAEGQKRDPAFTIVGADRVHPGEVDHLVMAYQLLKAQGLPGLVSAVAIDAAAATAKGERCAVSGLSVRDGAVAFTCLAESLPFPVAAGARPALALVPFAADLDRELLTVTGLPAGRYQVLIDDAVVQEADAGELAAGLDLALNEATPQYRQALAVKKLNDQRHELVSRRLRTIEAVWHFTLSREPGLARDDVAGAEKVLRLRLEKAKADGNQHSKWQLETYLEWKPRQAEVERQAAEAAEAMWAAAVPVAHRYLIRPKG